MAQAVLRPHLPHPQDRLYHCGISAFILTEQRRCRGKPPPPHAVRLLHGAGTV